jgi:hypothetical protein
MKMTAKELYEFLLNNGKCTAYDPDCPAQAELIAKRLAAQRVDCDDKPIGILDIFCYCGKQNYQNAIIKQTQKDRARQRAWA